MCFGASFWCAMCVHGAIQKSRAIILMTNEMHLGGFLHVKISLS